MNCLILLVRNALQTSPPAVQNLNTTPNWSLYHPEGSRALTLPKKSYLKIFNKVTELLNVSLLQCLLTEIWMILKKEIRTKDS